MKRILSFLLVALLVGAALAACGSDDDDDDDDGGSDNVPAATTASGADDESTAPSEAESTEPSESSGSDDEDDEDDASELDIHVPLEVGSSGEVESSNPDPFAVDDDQGTVKVTIDAIIDPAEATNAFFEVTAGNRLWAVEVTLEATGDKTVNTGEWTLRTTDGNEYETLFLSGVGEDIMYGAIEAGASEQGVLVFEIPEDAEVEWLKMNASIYVTGELYFDA